MNWFPISILMDDEYLILFSCPLFKTFSPMLQVRSSAPLSSLSFYPEDNVPHKVYFFLLEDSVSSFYFITKGHFLKNFRGDIITK